MKEATHEITACYFPKKGEVDLTWEDLDTHEKAALTTKVSHAVGMQIAKVVMPCVWQDAVLKRQTISALTEAFRDENIALRNILKAILDGLPTNRDWFDPDVERVARKLTETK